MKNGIIAFCGSKFSGKSTSANILKDLLPGMTEELAFAAHLKTTCSKVFNVDMKYFLDPKLKEVELEAFVVLKAKEIQQIFTEFDVKDTDFDKHVRPHIGQVLDTPRSLLQYVGTEILHPIDPLIHAKITIAKKDPNKLSVITDLRFLQEFEFLKTQSNFLPVYVYNSKAEMMASSDTHKSEVELKLFKSKCDTLDNNRDIKDLSEGIKNLVNKYYR